MRRKKSNLKSRKPKSKNALMRVDSSKDLSIINGNFFEEGFQELTLARFFKVEPLKDSDMVVEGFLGLVKRKEV